MATTSIEQYYNQARLWSEAKLDRYLLARSAESDVPLVVAITLAKISRTIDSQNKEHPENVLQDPEDLLKYLVEESISCSDLDKEVTVRILFSIAQRYLDECEQVREEPLQALLRAGAKICHSYECSALDRATVVHTLRTITQTELNWNDVAAFGKGDSIRLGVHYEPGQKLSCKIEYEMTDGYAVTMLGNKGVTGLIKTDQYLQIGSSVDAYFSSVEKNRALLSLIPPTEKSLQDRIV